MLRVFLLANDEEEANTFLDLAIATDASLLHRNENLFSILTVGLPRKPNSKSTLRRV